MDRPFTGYDKKYSDNYNKIFRKSFKEKLIIWFNKILYKLFLK